MGGGPMRTSIGGRVYTAHEITGGLTRSGSRIPAVALVAEQMVGTSDDILVLPTSDSIRMNDHADRKSEADTEENKAASRA